MKPAPRLALVCSHPVQYYAPWFRALAADGLPLRVFYLWDGYGDAPDPGFARPVAWDLDLLSGYEHEFVPNTARDRGTHRFLGLRNPALLARLRAFRPDAVLAFGYGWHALLHLALRWRDCPLLLRGDTHLLGRDDAPSPRAFLRRHALRLILGRYAGFASVGAAHTRFLLAHGVSPDRVHPVPHCVDNARWTAQSAAPAAVAALRDSLAIPPGRRVVLFAGKLEPKKRPDLLLAAFLRAAPDNSVLLFVGNGPLEAALRERAAASPGVRFLPFQNQQELPVALGLADLLALPSQGPGETWGLIVNEAMAAGLPCLVSTHVGCREDLVVEDETGWSFPAGDEAALAARLRHALAALARDGAGFRERVRRRVALYDYAHATAGLRAALAAVCCGSNPRADR